MKNKQNIIGKTLQGKGKERGYNYHEIPLIPSNMDEANLHLLT